MPPQYEEVDIGDAEPVRCLKNGLWFLRRDGIKFLVLLREDADILFILTTNRPEQLEQALASRPGRIDQAMEFGLPDAEAREKLVVLYSRGVEVRADVRQRIVTRTEKVSAAFIKELMRRAVQFHLERNGAGWVELADVESALNEMLFSGGSLNLKLLGGVGVDSSRSEYPNFPE